MRERSVLRLRGCINKPGTVGGAIYAKAATPPQGSIVAGDEELVTTDPKASPSPQGSIAAEDEELGATDPKASPSLQGSIAAEDEELGVNEPKSGDASLRRRRRTDC